MKKKQFTRSRRPEVFYKKGVHKYFTSFTRKHLHQSHFFNKVSLFLLKGNFNKEETLGQVFSYDFCQIFKNNFLQNTSSGCFCFTTIQLQGSQKKCIKNQPTSFVSDFLVFHGSFRFSSQFFTTYLMSSTQRQE